MDYLNIFKRFNELKVDYLVVGGLAVNLHGVPRMTYDIDFIIRMEEENILKVISQFEAWGYRPRAPVNPKDLVDEEKRKKWMQERGLKAFSFYSEHLPIAELDLVLDPPKPYIELKARAVELDVQSVKIWVISIKDLIDMKLRAGRRQDLADVEHLKLLLEDEGLKDGERK